MPSSFTGSFLSLSKSRDVEDKSATRTGSLAEGYVHPAAMGGEEAVTEPSKNSRRLFEMSPMLMLASREKRSVMRRDWRNKRFLSEQTTHNQKAEDEARTAVTARSDKRAASMDAGMDRQKVVRIQSDRWTEWRDAHQRRQAEVAREQYLERLPKRPKSAPPLDQFLNTSSGNNSDAEGRSTTPEPKTTAGPTLTTHVPQRDTRHHTPVLGMLSAIKREANSFAREKNQKQPGTAASAKQTGAEAKRIEAAAHIKNEQKEEEKQQDKQHVAQPKTAELEPKKITKANRTDSDLLDLYDDAAVSLMTGFSGRMREPAKKKPARKAATWDEQDDMAFHFLSSMSGARSPSPGPGPVDPFTRSYSPVRQAKTPRHGSQGTVSPVSPETPGKLELLSDMPSAPRHEPQNTIPRISITAE